MMDDLPPKPVLRKVSLIRHTADGSESLDYAAKRLNVTVGHLISINRTSGMYRWRMKHFNKYVTGGTDKLMPDGLVWYSDTKAPVAE
jgi:hypothetical protein